MDKLELAERRILGRLDTSGDCWLWTGALDHRGRGRVWRNGKIVLHHRAVWEILVGPIPEGALLCHHCDNPQCANPEHLYIGDDKSNVRDMWERGRHWTQQQPERARELGKQYGKLNTWARGSGNPKAKLTPAQVEEIKTATGSSYAIASRYGVNATTVQRIRRGEAWTR
jgi:hypothetical protein